MNAVQATLLNIVSSIAAGGAAGAALFWIFRSWISERLKASIQHEYEQKLETLKNQLRHDTERSLTQYGLIYKECLDVYSGTYARLAAFDRRVRDYVSFWGDLGDERALRRQEAAKALTEVQAYILPKRIFLPEHLVMQIEGLIHELYAITTKFMIFVEVPDREYDERKGNIEKWTEVADILDKKLTPIMRELESDFRKLLGTPEDGQRTTRGV
ncbi:MAG TPA: hypothetical protein VHD85_16190 [Terracidiphilus sp.]|nr:hypothetical protein [Terracidiphilus sp.]